MSRQIIRKQLLANRSYNDDPLRHRTLVPAHKSNLERLQDFECPICTGYATPPVPICKRGHVTCDTCLGRLPQDPEGRTRCSICQLNDKFTTSVILDSIAIKLFFPCRFSHNGCKRTLPFWELKEHESRCRKYDPSKDDFVEDPEFNNDIVFDFNGVTGDVNEGVNEELSEAESIRDVLYAAYLEEERRIGFNVQDSEEEEW